ncbi:MAG: glycosyltransferase [Caldilineaceae bacterium]
MLLFFRLFLQPLLQTLYTLCALYLVAYGAQSAWLIYLYLQKRNFTSPAKQWFTSGGDAKVVSLPYVTIQLPIYNEHHVVERLIDACTRQNYPKERLQIQVLDDSDDLTTTLAEARADYWRKHGYQVDVLRRSNRIGYKAGALAHALPLAQGEFIAIFDADFLPPADFLAKTVPHLLDEVNQDVGFIQTRWEHLNREYSALTQCQALALDAHFAIEQPVRSQSGYLFGFNGSAGIWRRECIEDPDVGGWQHDTLCEDLDLSYRAQLCGWQGLFLEDVFAPAEIPPQLLAFKRQQARWAKGSIQTLRKLSRRVWKSEKKLGVRIAGLLHLSNYILHPALLLMLLLTLPFLLTGTHTSAILAPLSITSLFTPLLYTLAQRKLHPKNWLRQLLYLPMLAVLGMGLSLSNSVAVWQALLGKQGTFLRTPKFRVEAEGDHWQGSIYRLPLDGLLIGEILLLLNALVTTGVAIAQRNVATAFFMLLYALGFGLSISIQLGQAWSARRVVRRRTVMPTKGPLPTTSLAAPSLPDFTTTKSQSTTV